MGINIFGVDIAAKLGLYYSEPQHNRNAADGIKTELAQVER